MIARLSLDRLHHTYDPLISFDVDWSDYSGSLTRTRGDAPIDDWSFHLYGPEQDRLASFIPDTDRVLNVLTVLVWRYK